MSFNRRHLLRTGLIGLGAGFALRGQAIDAHASSDKKDVVSGDFEMYASTWKRGDKRDPRSVPPANRWMYINNTYGRGNLVNGQDFTCTMRAMQSTFPKNALLEWDFHEGGDAGTGPFAYGYPALMYGGNPWGNAFDTRGPWPQRISDCRQLTIDYDVAIGGNTNSFNLLIDLYATEAPDSTDGSATGELSFFPYANADLPFVDDGELMTLSFGECWVGRQGRQMCFQPSSRGGRQRRTILSGKIDLLELFKVCISKGWVTGDNYLRGAEFGAEIQIPANYNTPPCKGSLLFKKAPAWEWI